MNFKGKISNIKLFGYHGILDHEIEQGQNFEIDIDYMYSIPYKHLNDEIQNTVDYMDVYLVVKSVFKNETRRRNILSKQKNEMRVSLSMITHWGLAKLIAPF